MIHESHCAPHRSARHPACRLFSARKPAKAAAPPRHAKTGHRAGARAGGATFHPADRVSLPRAPGIGSGIPRRPRRHQPSRSRLQRQFPRPVRDGPTRRPANPQLRRSSPLRQSRGPPCRKLSRGRNQTTPGAGDRPPPRGQAYSGPAWTSPALSTAQKEVRATIRNYLALSDDAEKHNDPRQADAFAERAQILAKELQSGK